MKINKEYITSKILDNCLYDIENYNYIFDNSLVDLYQLEDEAKEIIQKALKKIERSEYPLEEQDLQTNKIEEKIETLSEKYKKEINNLRFENFDEWVRIEYTNSEEIIEWLYKDGLEYKALKLAEKYFDSNKEEDRKEIDKFLNVQEEKKSLYWVI